METPLTPLDFARRARKFHGAREAVVDGEVRFTYAEFCARCDAWAAGLRKLGVGRGDRVATIAPNTHQHLEQFYAIPQCGAVIVPMNYRLSAEDFVYMTEHSGSKVLCAHSEHLDLIDGVRSRMPGVQHFVALEGSRPGWLTYESLLEGGGSGAADVDGLSESDLLAINYTSGTTSRPKGVMITHRNAWMNSVGTLTHWPMTPADRYLWTLPMFHANGWTFTWTVTAAAAAHVCLRKVDAAQIYALVNRERVTHLCAAPTVLIGIANGGEAPPGTCRSVSVCSAVSNTLFVSSSTNSGTPSLRSAIWSTTASGSVLPETCTISAIRSRRSRRFNASIVTRGWPAQGGWNSGRNVMTSSIFRSRARSMIMSSNSRDVASIQCASSKIATTGC